MLVLPFLVLLDEVVGPVAATVVVEISLHLDGEGFENDVAGRRIEHPIDAPAIGDRLEPCGIGEHAR